MIFLVDNQLPPGLVGHFKNHGLEAIHVGDCGLDQATDMEIWDYAKVHDCVIVSKDEDFFHLSVKDGNGTPIVWVRLGNCRNTALFAAFDAVLSDMLESITSGAKVVEVL